MSSAVVPRGQHDPLVYFVELGSHVKIGTSTNLTARLAGLSLPARFVTLTIPGGRDLETSIHRIFDIEREPGSEWFIRSDRLRTYIETQRGTTAPEEPERIPITWVEERVIVEAARIVVEEQWASATMLQRKMKVGWAKADSLITELERRGVVSPLSARGAMREVLVDTLTA